MSQEHYKWDKFSDQPHSITNKAYKKEVRRRAIPAFFKMLITTLLLIPFLGIKYFFSAIYSLPVKTKNMIGLCINADKSPEKVKALVEDLELTSLSIRIPMSDIENLKKYYDYISQFTEYNLFIVILQDRRHIEDKALCKKSLKNIFEKIKPLTKKIQIGNAINRTKWGFDSVDEYLEFYKIAYLLNQENNYGLTLFGSAVIDFEFNAIIRSLFNFYRFSYDGLSSLLYVDRRGAPENQQFIFDLPKKILLIKCIAGLSPKVGRRFVISETNWPIENTQPYAPALDDVWVSEEKHANYLCRYFLLAMCSGAVETIFWHQLIAPGYGLIDDRDGKFIKRAGYFYLKTLIRFFSNVTIQSININGDLYCVTALDQQGKTISAQWSKVGEYNQELPADMLAYDALGKPIIASQIKVDESVTYFCSK